MRSIVVQGCDFPASVPMGATKTLHWVHCTTLSPMQENNLKCRSGWLKMWPSWKCHIKDLTCDWKKIIHLGTKREAARAASWGGMRDGKEMVELRRSTAAPPHTESGESPLQAALAKGQQGTYGSSSCAYSSAGILFPGELESWATSCVCSAEPLWLPARSEVLWPCRSMCGGPDQSNMSQPGHGGRKLCSAFIERIGEG